MAEQFTRLQDPSSRTIIIGDIHGCSEEVKDLLQLLDVHPSDQLISVGDLICKGPDSLGVLLWAMNTPNLTCILGNHEARFLKYWRQDKRSEEKIYDAETYQQLEPHYYMCMNFINTWPLYKETKDFLVVHAGIDPRKGAISNQKVEDLLNLRKLENGEPWYQTYREEKTVLFGHWAKPEPQVRPNAIGLDTGCVYGGELSAWIFPERRLVSVPARRCYRKKEDWPKRK